MNEAADPITPSRFMRKMVLVAAVIIIVIGAVFYRSLAVIPFALGVLATSFLNVHKIRMLERTVEKVLDMEDQQDGKNTVRLQYLLRYFMTGVVLVIIGLIQNYTTPPPFYSSREWYIAVWAILFPGAPESLTTAPLISIWGAIFGIFTLQLSVLLLKIFKREKDGTNFIKYEDDDENTDDNAEVEAKEGETDIENSDEATTEENDENHIENHVDS